jgi:hypothetical protein
MESADGTPLAGDDWQIDLDPDGAHDVRVRIRYDGSRPIDARVRVEAPVPGAGDEAPYWLVPGVFYGANRDPECQRIYPRYAPGELDAADLTADHWAFRADRSATPAVFAWGAEAGIALEVDATTPLGLSGLGFGAGPGRPASVWLSLPYREEPFSYTGDPHGVPALSDAYRWQPGESHDVRIGVWDLTADRHDYDRVLRSVGPADGRRVRRSNRGST